MLLDGYISTTEAARRLGVSPGRVRQFVAEGRLTAVKIGWQNFVPVAEVEQLGRKERKSGPRPKPESELTRSGRSRRRTRERARKSGKVAGRGSRQG